MEVPVLHQLTLSGAGPLAGLPDEDPSAGNHSGDAAVVSGAVRAVEPGQAALSDDLTFSASKLAAQREEAGETSGSLRRGLRKAQRSVP